jgi:hypothetical protein
MLRASRVWCSSQRITDRTHSSSTAHLIGDHGTRARLELGLGAQHGIVARVRRLRLLQLGGVQRLRVGRNIGRVLRAELDDFSEVLRNLGVRVLIVHGLRRNLLLLVVQGAGRVGRNVVEAGSHLAHLGAGVRDRRRQLGARHELTRVNALLQREHALPLLHGRVEQCAEVAGGLLRRRVRGGLGAGGNIFRL